MMRRGRVSYANAAAQQEGHAQPATAHVLHFGDLIDDFTERVVDKVDEHEIDDRARAGHCCAAPEADESPFADWRVAQPFGAVFGEQAGGSGKVATARADALAENENSRVARHLVVERLEGGAGEGE